MTYWDWEIDSKSNYFVTSIVNVNLKLMQRYIMFMKSWSAIVWNLNLFSTNPSQHYRACCKFFDKNHMNICAPASSPEHQHPLTAFIDSKAIEIIDWGVSQWFWFPISAPIISKYPLDICDIKISVFASISVSEICQNRWKPPPTPNGRA